MVNIVNYKQTRKRRSRGGFILRRKNYYCKSILVWILLLLITVAFLLNVFFYLAILPNDDNNYVLLAAGGDSTRTAHNNNHDDTNSTTFWEWHRYAKHRPKNNQTIDSNDKSNNTTTKARGNLLIAQYSSKATTTTSSSSSSSSSYNSILKATSLINRAYAKKYGYDYVILWGIAYTFTSFWETWYPWCRPKPSRSIYNKIAILHYAIANKQKYDYLLILDADAMLYDFNRNILDLTAAAPAAAPHDDYLLTTHRVKSEENSVDTYNINNGVTLWNLHHPDALYVANLWDHAAKQRIFRNAWDSDQRALQGIFISEHEQRTRRHWVYAIAGQFGGYERGRMVRHFKRPNRKSWTAKMDDASQKERIQSIQASVQEVCQKYAPICDEIRIEEEEEEKEKKD